MEQKEGNPDGVTLMNNSLQNLFRLFLLLSDKIRSEQHESPECYHENPGPQVDVVSQGLNIHVLVSIGEEAKNRENDPQY